MLFLHTARPKHELRAVVLDLAVDIELHCSFEMYSLRETAAILSFLCHMLQVLDVENGLLFGNYFWDLPGALASDPSQVCC
jgi:hypothetical protein